MLIQSSEQIEDSSGMKPAQPLNDVDFQKRYLSIESQERNCWDKINAQGIKSWADRYEDLADAYPMHPVVIDVNGDITWTYRDLDINADKVAFWAVKQQRTFIGICMDNSPQFLAAVVGLAKAGVTAVLFNTREPVHRLTDLAQRSDVSLVLTLAEAGDAIAGQDVIPGLVNQNIDQLLAIDPLPRCPRHYRQAITLDDPAVVIFTSGTSGPSKGALFSHRRLIGAGIAWSLRNGFNQQTRCYISLPLYHGNGLAVAFASCIEAGGTAIIRQRFSVNAFWLDIRQYECDSMVYIGELWRYLLNMPALATDAENPLKTIFGNGLSADIWLPVVERFSIDHVVEHFGATELPASALTNALDVPGFCGYIPPNHSDAKAVILVDEANQVVVNGEIGEALLRVPGDTYRGYLNKAHNDSKVIKGLFEKDDLWWRSGDLLKRSDQGFFTFVERLDGSFRYKGENVSAEDVEQAIYASNKVIEVAVFGVQLVGVSGKVGMASLVAKHVMTPDDLDALLGFLKTRLAPYAIPQILRMMPEKHQTTATLKIPKAKLAKEASGYFDAYPHFILSEGRYQLYDKANPINPESSDNRLLLKG